MSLLVTIRRRQFRASRLVAAVAALAWLGSVVVPCQAAMDTAHAGTSHHGSMPAGNCDHCTDTRTTPDTGCSSLIAAGCLAESPALLDRHVTSDQWPTAAPPPAIPDIGLPSADTGFAGNVRFRPIPVSATSLQQRYCTYLK